MPLRRKTSYWSHVLVRDRGAQFTGENKFRSSQQASQSNICSKILFVLGWIAHTYPYLQNMTLNSTVCHRKLLGRESIKMEIYIHH